MLTTLPSFLSWYRKFVNEMASHFFDQSGYFVEVRKFDEIYRRQIAAFEATFHTENERLTNEYSPFIKKLDLKRMTDRQKIEKDSAEAVRNEKNYGKQLILADHFNTAIAISEFEWSTARDKAHKDWRKKQQILEEKLNNETRPFGEVHDQMRRVLEKKFRRRALFKILKIFRKDVHKHAAFCGCGKAILLSKVATRERFDEVLLACRECGFCKACCTCPRCRSCRRRMTAGNTCGTCNDCGNCCCCCSYCGGCERRVTSETYHSDCDRCHTCCRCAHREPSVPRPRRSTSRTNSSGILFDSPLVFHPATKEAWTPKLRLTEKKENASERWISAEIEVAAGGGPQIQGVVRKWSGSIVRDGSLPETGYEINTAPAAGDFYPKQVREICDALAAEGATITEQCGLHVHVDARDMKYFDIRRLIRVYAYIESNLFAMVPYSRRASRFCKPCGNDYQTLMASRRMPEPPARNATVSRSRFNTVTDTTSTGFSNFDAIMARMNENASPTPPPPYNGVEEGRCNCGPCTKFRVFQHNGGGKKKKRVISERKKAFLAEKKKRKEVKSRFHEMIYPNRSGLSLKETKKHKYWNARYNALNLHSWGLRGTVECRMYPGTISAREIILWGVLWARICDYAMSKSDKEVTAEMRIMNSQRFFKRIAGTQEMVAFIDEKTRENS